MRLSLMVGMNCTLKFMKSIESRGKSYSWCLGMEYVRIPGLVTLEMISTQALSL
jgi:hypothetical protein